MHKVNLGRVAQLVEQRTENPRVGSSILPPATIFLPDSSCPTTSLLRAINDISLHGVYLLGLLANRLNALDAGIARELQ